MPPECVCFTFLAYGEPCPCVWRFLLVKCFSINLDVFLNLWKPPEDCFAVVCRTVCRTAFKFKNEFKTNTTITITFSSREQVPSPLFAVKFWGYLWESDLLLAVLPYSWLTGYFCMLGHFDLTCFWIISQLEAKRDTAY